MANPIELFFGPTAVRLLQNRPDWLAQIAERAKRFMTAQVHESGPKPDPLLAAEISQAYNELKDAGRFPELLEEYFRELQLQNFWEGEVRRVRREVEAREDEIGRLTRRNEQLVAQQRQQRKEVSGEETGWFKYFADWYFAVHPLQRETPKRRSAPNYAIPLASLWQYRLILHDANRDGSESDKWYNVIHTDATRRVRRHFCTSDISKAKRLRLKGSKVSGVVSKGTGRVVLGFTEQDVTGENLVDLLKTRAIQPFAKLGWYLVYSTEPDRLAKYSIVRTSGRLVEAIELNPGRGQENKVDPSLENRVRAHKRKVHQKKKS